MIPENVYLGRVKRIWYLSPMRAAKIQASLRIRAVSPEPSLLAHTSSESRGTFRQKARSLAPLNGWASAVKVSHDGMLEDTNSLDGAHLMAIIWLHHNRNCLGKSNSRNWPRSSEWLHQCITFIHSRNLGECIMIHCLSHLLTVYSFWPSVNWP